MLELWFILLDNRVIEYALIFYETECSVRDPLCDFSNLTSLYLRFAILYSLPTKKLSPLELVIPIVASLSAGFGTVALFNSVGVQV